MTRATGSRTVRLFVHEPLDEGEEIEAGPAQAHYLRNVMRLGPGDSVALFNGRDGEWLATVAPSGRRGCRLAVARKLREQYSEPDLWLLFAPVKRARIDFVAQKATELGVSALRPVFTRHTDVTRVNVERLRANAVEAAEQCERLTIPSVEPPAALDDALASWPADRPILLCDESLGGVPIREALEEIAPGSAGAVLTGPEGGFAEEERQWLAGLPMVRPVHVGPRILRTETAAVAALACWQALVGDWR